jgi:hypothetical protein
LADAKLYQTEYNAMRMSDNLKGKEIETQQLNSIKERVWKKHK